MVGRSKKRQDTGPNREQLRRDKDVVEYRRSAKAPARYVPQIHVMREVSVLDLLGKEDANEDSSKHNGH
jgi:hypothetical protein